MNCKECSKKKKLTISIIDEINPTKTTKFCSWKCLFIFILKLTIKAIEVMK